MLKALTSLLPTDDCTQACSPSHVYGVSPWQPCTSQGWWCTPVDTGFGVHCCATRWQVYAYEEVTAVLAKDAHHFQSVLQTGVPLLSQPGSCCRHGDQHVTAGELPPHDLHTVCWRSVAMWTKHWRQTAGSDGDSARCYRSKNIPENWNRE